jgi:hemolysin III
MFEAWIIPRLAERPRLRGALHLLGFIVAAAAGPILVAATGWRWPVAVYAASLALMLGVSAAYHRGPWSPAVRRWWQRADHAAIFVFIAGTYTPLGAIAMPASSGHPLLAVVWVGAALGVLRALAWPHAPRWIAASPVRRPRLVDGDRPCPRCCAPPARRSWP